VPEGLEAEIWRRACVPLVGRTIVDVVADERVVPTGFGQVVTAAEIVGVRRLGKVVVLDTDRAVIGVHFAMTGRLVVDGRAPIERLAYSSGRDDPRWDRLTLFADHAGAPAALRFNDPRRLGHVSLDADFDGLGVDYSAVTPRRLTAALVGRRSAIKPTLLDQGAVAGIGNLCADEVLWWAGLAPARTADSLDADEVARLARTIRRRLAIMLRRGGSTTGTIDPAVRAGCPPCPRDGTPLRRSTIAGRTAVWCPGHQQ